MLRRELVNCDDGKGVGDEQEGIVIKWGVGVGLQFVINVYMFPPKVNHVQSRSSIHLLQMMVNYSQQHQVLWIHQ